MKHTFIIFTKISSNINIIKCVNKAMHEQLIHTHTVQH